MQHGLYAYSQKKTEVVPPGAVPPFFPGFELVPAPPEVASGAPILHTTSTRTADAGGHRACFYSAALAPHQPRPDELREELNQVYKARELLRCQATMLERELERRLSFLSDFMVLDMENLYTLYIYMKYTGYSVI